MKQTKTSSFPAPSVATDAGGHTTGNETIVTVNNEAATLPNSRRITAGTGIGIVDGGAGNPVTVNNSSPENTSVANVGTGAGQSYRDMTGSQINLKTVKAGAGVTVTNNADDITVANGSPENTSVANVGTGAGQSYRDMTGSQINLKTIKAGINIAVANNADEIIISNPSPEAATPFVLIDDSDSPYTPDISDRIIYCDTSAGTITINLPAGVNQRFFEIRNIGHAANDVSIVPDGAELFFGSNATYAVTDGLWVSGRYVPTLGWS